MTTASITQHTLSADLQQLFNGQIAAGKESMAIQVTAIAENGWPHTTLLSLGEILAPAGDTLMFCVWLQSSLVSSIWCISNISLSFVWHGCYTEIQANARLVKQLHHLPVPLAIFKAQVQRIRSVSAGYATLTHGISFHLQQPEQDLPRWQSQLHLLQEYAGAAAQ
ncbi:hypothetical protein [Deminuibacter soli]|uniref:Uncharacterized protein n=1 Tax=Deminuibacter soli TaxID=2291815 RepID=A0A3E1NCD0_9BACT|nr:hypothetical protein [Deminuibacter soli]RFM25636.1 hypothetical protein DXN05_24180 [Deminuibacter soli]